MQQTFQLRNDYAVSLRQSTFKKIIMERRSKLQEEMDLDNFDELDEADLELLQELHDLVYYFVALDIYNIKIPDLKEYLEKMQDLLRKATRSTKGQNAIRDICNRYNITDCLFWVFSNRKSQQDIMIMLCPVLVNLSSIPNCDTRFFSEANLKALVSRIPVESSIKRFESYIAVITNCLIDYPETMVKALIGNKIIYVANQVFDNFEKDKYLTEESFVGAICEMLRVMLAQMYDKKINLELQCVRLGRADLVDEATDEKVQRYDL